MWAFADTSGGRGVDSASYAAGFLSLLLTTHGKANLAKFPAIIFPLTTYYRKKRNFGNVLRKFLNYFIAAQNPAWFWAQKNRKPFLDFLSLAAADGRRLSCCHSPEANL